MDGAFTALCQVYLNRSHSDTDTDVHLVVMSPLLSAYDNLKFALKQEQQKKHGANLAKLNIE